MKLVIHPAVGAVNNDQRLEKIILAAGPMEVINAGDEKEALHEIVAANAFFGKLTPPLLQAAQKLRWVGPSTYL